MNRPVLAVFGGSFDPPHLGHVMLPTYVLARGWADRVLVAVSYAHPFGKVQSPFSTRLAWTRLAMRVHGPQVEVSDIEYLLAEARPGPTYTIDMLDAVAAAHPQFEVRLVVGSDIVERGDTKRWHRFDEIETRYRPIIVPRRIDPDEPGVLPAVSSTQVRAWLAQAADPTVRQKLERHVPHTVLKQLDQPPNYRAITIVGRGHAGTRLAAWLRARGHTVAHVGAREVVDDPSSLKIDQDCAGLWLLVRDDRLEALAHVLTQARFPSPLPVLSGSGSQIAARCLAALRTLGHPVGTLHPICSLRREHAATWLDTAAFGIEGDPPACALARSIVGDQPWLDLTSHDADARARYHAACSLAANHLAVLLAASSDTLTSLGHPPHVSTAAMATLMRSALDNLLHLGIPHGITGPVARGDQATVDAHVRALDGPVAELYRVLSAALVRLMPPSSE